MPPLQVMLFRAYAGADAMKSAMASENKYLVALRNID
jgi:hypothetical protein